MLWSELVERDVDVTLPKFQIKWGTVNLADAMKQLGMTDAFLPQANFSGITDSPEGMAIGAIFHQAFVDVNEEGTEAAAATAVVMMPGGAAPSKPKVFRADRPFLFLIREKATGTILFLGRVLDPRGE